MKSSHYFALFALTLFFSLFSIVSLLLQTTSTVLLSVVADSHFLSRVLLVALALSLFIFFPKKTFLNRPEFFLILLLISYVISFVSLFFVRDGNPKFYSEVISPSLLLVGSNVLFLTSVLDNDNLVLEDVFLSSFLLSSSVVISFLLTDFAFSLIAFLTISLLCFSYKFSFGLKVSILSFLIVFIVLLSFFMNKTFVTTFFSGLSVNKPFMTFYEKTEYSLSSSLTPFVFFEYATGEMIFALLYRFKVYGSLVFTLLLLVLVILCFSSSAKEEKLGCEKEAKRSYGISLLFGFILIFSMLSLATSLPVFKCDLPFITPSNLSVFTEILLLSYVSSSLKNTLEIQENAVLNTSET